jgi:hypothetical protein
MAVLYLKKFLLNIVYWHDDKAFLRRVTHHVLKGDSKRHLISIVKYDDKPGILALIRVKDVTLQ